MNTQCNGALLKHANLKLTGDDAELAAEQQNRLTVKP
jgi:hypothetical protein